MRILGTTVQPYQHAPLRSGEDILYHSEGDLLLQGHALRVEERRGNLSTAGEKNVLVPDRANDGGLC